MKRTKTNNTKNKVIKAFLPILWIISLMFSSIGQIAIHAQESTEEGETELIIEEVLESEENGEEPESVEEAGESETPNDVDEDADNIEESDVDLEDESEQQEPEETTNPVAKEDNTEETTEDETEKVEEVEKQGNSTEEPTVFRVARASHEPITSEKTINYRAKLTRAPDGINTKPWGTEGYETIRKVRDLVGRSVKVTKEAVTPRATWSYIEVIGTNIAGWIDKSGLQIETITSEKTIRYDAELTRHYDGINTLPFGTEGYETIRKVDDLVGQTVRVSKEAVTSRATWAYIEVPNTDITGWIDTAGLKKLETITSARNVKYYGTLARSTDGINTKPWGVSGFQTVRRVGNWTGRTVRVTQEAITPRATWSYVEIIGTNVSGWIDKKGLDIEKITSERTVNYEALFTRSSDGINTKPFGTEGYDTIRIVGDLVGTEVQVTREATTRRATWSYVKVPGTDIAGWIDKDGLKEEEKILSEKEITYYGELSRSSDGINTKPWGISGFETIRKVRDWKGRSVKVTKEAVTPRATWSYVEVIGTNVSGWIDKKGLDVERILSEKSISYDAELIRSYDGINTKPWGTEGFETIRTVGDLVGTKVEVTKEAITQRSVWAFITIPGTNVSGWIDKAGLKHKTIIYLDPGHGGIPATGGNPGPVYNGVREQDLNLNISLQVRDRLEKLGYEVIMSRENDLNSYHNGWEDDLYARPAHANELGADILVSVHHNAHPSSRAVNGIETYIYGTNPSHPPLPENEGSHNNPQRISESRKLANSIHNDLVSNTGALDRGVKDGAYIVVREAKMPAVLLELGFMSNPTEFGKLRTNSYQQKLINGIVTGIHSYFLI